MLYLGLTTLLFLLRYALAGSRGVARQLYYPVLLALFLFSAYRWQVGCDWSGYYNQYLVAANRDWSQISSNTEPLWWGVLRLIQDAGLPYPYANVVSSVIFFAGVHVLARKQRDPLGFLVLLFPILIINMPMSGLRQAAAIGLICIALTQFIDRRPIWYLFWVVIAVGFHTSAAIFVLLLPLATGKYTTKRLVAAGMLAIPGALALATGGSAEVAAQRYIETGVDAAGAAFRVGILALSALYFYLFVRKKWRQIFPNDYSIVSIGAIAMALTVFLLPLSSVIADRLGYYLIPIQVMMFARLPFLEFKRNQGLHSAAPYLGLWLTFAVWSQLSYHFYKCYIPYSTWIFGIPEGNILKGMYF
ncbi:MAG: EpsG family protein [Erythrobacter sp.]